MNISFLHQELEELLGSEFQLSFDSKGRLVIKTSLIEDVNGDLIEYDEESLDDSEDYDDEDLNSDYL